MGRSLYASFDAAQWNPQRKVGLRKSSLSAEVRALRLDFSGGKLCLAGAGSEVVSAGLSPALAAMLEPGTDKRGASLRLGAQGWEVNQKRWSAGER